MVSGLLLLKMNLPQLPTLNIYHGQQLWLEMKKKNAVWGLTQFSYQEYSKVSLQFQPILSSPPPIQHVPKSQLPEAMFKQVTELCQSHFQWKGWQNQQKTHKVNEEQPAVCFWINYLTKGNYFSLQSVINIILF